MCYVGCRFVCLLPLLQNGYLNPNPNSNVDRKTYMTRKHLNLNRGKNRFSFRFVYRRFEMHMRTKSTFSFPIELLDHVPVRFSVIEHILALLCILFRLSIFASCKQTNNTVSSIGIASVHAM